MTTASTSQQMDLLADWFEIPKADILTVKRAAKLLTLGEQSVRDLMALGELHGPRFQLTGEKEKTPRILTLSALAYLLKSTPDLTPELFERIQRDFIARHHTRAVCERTLALLRTQHARL